MFACVAVLSFTKRVKKEKTNRARGGVSPSRSIYYSMCDEPPLKGFIFFDSKNQAFFRLTQFAEETNATQFFYT